jgi:hypothetical protein
MRIGITGHQDLGSAEIKHWLQQQLEDIITQLNISYGYSCLALGADQLFASTLLKHDIPLIAVIPCKNYEQTFDEKSRNKYWSFIESSVERLELDYEEPSEMAFFDASKLVVNNCELMIAIWNGLPSKGFGGTADVVRYTIGIHKKLIHINPISNTLKHL